jgi:L-asparagine oxygenase
VRSATATTTRLPSDVRDALRHVARHGDPSGAVLIRGVPLGRVGATPPSPTARADKDGVSERMLLAAGRTLGQPVGYEPEHGGDLVQNIVPTANATNRQVSTSSKVELMFHTEAAFHPHRPRFLLLLCLRGDPSARTTLCSIASVLPHLRPATVDTLFQRRFRTAVDESYLHGRRNRLGEPMAVLSGDRDRPTMIFDADLMVGVDDAAEDALHELGQAVTEHATGHVLEAGDLLVVDNHAAVHGRSPFTPRFDGTDRWLQRTFVVEDLRPSAGERRGRVITTVFGD